MAKDAGFAGIAEEDGMLIFPGEGVSVKLSRVQPDKTAKKLNEPTPPDANTLHQGPAGQLPDTITIDGVERPTTNSNGKPIHPTEDGVRKFWEWFGDGAFVDEAGRPIVFFHSTLEDKAAFDKYGLFMGYTGVSGISVTDNPEMASRYLDRFGNFRFDGKAFEKNVMAVYINASKPLYRQEPFKTNLRLGAPLPKDVYKRQVLGRQLAASFAASLKPACT